MFIVILGGGINLSGDLPDHVYQRLNKAIDLYKKNPQTKIIATGKYSFLYDQIKKYPALTESEKMSEYLVKKEIPKKDILLENKSKDTISNAYYLKKNFFIPKKETQATIITSHFHLDRVKYIFQKVFGPGYDFQFVGIQETLPKDEEKKVIDHQKYLLKRTKQILSPMKDGDHNFLKGKLYKIKYYREKRPGWVIDFVAKGK